MSNVLKVSRRRRYSLAERGWSQRRIARKLWINRETVGRYLRLAEAKPAISGHFEHGEELKPAISITGNLVGKEGIKTGNLVQQKRAVFFAFTAQTPWQQSLIGIIVIIGIAGCFFVLGQERGQKSRQFFGFMTQNKTQ